MSRKNVGAILSLLAVGAILLCAGCAMFSNVKTWSERTPQEKALSFYQIYNQQYEDTLRLANAGKKIANTKRAVLIEVRPLIFQYDDYVTKGQVSPSVMALLESKIIGLLDRLSRMEE